MAELSDLLHCKIQREHCDPHPVTVMILQMATGKTNQELKLYGRVGRHKNVNLCPIIGALGFDLLYHQFHYTGKWDIPPDFSDNESWFDVKILIDSVSACCNCNCHQ
jgi:hypothetical protein